MIGALGEQLACEYLQQRGYIILERNYRVKGGELDIIAKKHGELVFIEIKARSQERYGYPEEGVTYTKKKRMTRAIRSFLVRYTTVPRYCVDIIALTIDFASRKARIRHIRDIDFPEIE